MPDLIAPAMASGSIAGSDQPWIPVRADVVLRPWELVDAEAVVQAFGGPDIQRWHVRCAYSVDEASEWIVTWQRGWADESQLNWALADRRTGTLLGRASLKGLDLHDGSAEMAYWMVPAARRQGLCTEAVLELCRWAFDDASFHRIGLEHSTGHQASCRVATEAGFRAECTRRSSALHADGWHDMHAHALLANDVQDHTSRP